MSKYILSKRTYEKIDELNDKIELAKTLNVVLAVAPFIEIFTSKPDITTVWQISNTEWELFGKTVSKMGDFQKSVLRKFCFDEQAYNAMHNNRDDMNFWKEMKESFNN